MNFSIAVTEKWRGKDGGQGGEHTEWFRCTLWGERGEKLVNYIHKGDPLMVIGTIRTEKYTDKDGNDRYSTKLIVRDVQFLKGRDGGGQQRQQPTRETEPSGGSESAGYGGDDDIPFAYWEPAQQPL